MKVLKIFLFCFIILLMSFLLHNAVRGRIIKNLNEDDFVHSQEIEAETTNMESEEYE